jgi:hypothetical protein
MKQLRLQNGSVALVDDEDYEELSKFKWYADQRSRSCYIRRLERNNTPEGPRQRCVYLHRQIMQPPPGMDVDHINSDATDNRRENLRICTRSQNNQNARRRVDSNQSYKGVWITQNGKYASRIYDGGKKVHIGVYDNEVSAAEAYDRKAKELFGAYAKLNFEQ